MASKPPTLLNRMRAEYAATPGLKLTVEQACRLWPVDEESCRAALGALVAEGVLHETATGAYASLPAPAPLPAKAALEFHVRCPHCRKLNTVIREHTVHGHVTDRVFRCVACQQIISVAAQIPA
jgi:hypothetical protein